jgi:hypothetical protein
MTPTTLTRFRSLKPVDSAHARAIASWRAAVAQKRATVAAEIAASVRSRSGIPLKRAAPMTASPSSEPKVREIMNVLRRRGLLEELDEAVFEQTLEAARCYAQGRLSAIEWVRVLHELEAVQRVSR